MIRPGTRGAARDLARALDGVHGAPHTPQTDEALRVVAALSTARHDLEASTGLRPEFRDALRTRLVAVATVQPASQPEPERAPVRHVRRRTVVAAGALASVVAVTGVAVAASRSLPGDPFYGTKRAVQALELQVEGGTPAEQGLARLHLATERLSEVEAALRTPGALRGGGGREGQALALALGSDDAVLRALDDMDQEVRTGSQLMFGAYRVDHDATTVVTVEGWAQGHGDRIAALLPRVHDPVRARAEASLSLARKVQIGAAHLLATVPCTVNCPAASSPSAAPRPSVGSGTASPRVPRTPARSGGSGGSGPSSSSGPGASSSGTAGGGPGGSSSSASPVRPVPTVPAPGRVAPTAPGLPSMPLPSASAPRATAPGVPVPTVGGTLPALPGGTVPSGVPTLPGVGRTGAGLPSAPAVR